MDVGGAPSKLFANVNCRGSSTAFPLSRVDVVNTHTGDKVSFKLGDNLYTWNWWTEIPALQTVEYQVLGMPRAVTTYSIMIY